MLLIQPFKITKTHTRTFNLYNNTTTHTFRCSTFNNCILTVSKTTIIVSYFFNCLHVPQHISISHIFKTKSIFRIFIIYLFSLFYVTVRLSFWSTVPKPRKVATNINSYTRYREILFQKVASGYLLHFVQDGSSKNVLKHICCATHFVSMFVRGSILYKV